MIRLGILLLQAANGAQTDVVPPPVPHPEIACWGGERFWTPPGEPVSDFVSYDTRNDVQPFLITHNRDQFREGDALEQDYNFIDYWFGNPSHPIQARHYLYDSDRSVTVTLPGDAGARFSIEEIRARFPSDVLCYLQRRFERIEVLVADGYQELWSRPR